MDHLVWVSHDEHTVLRLTAPNPGDGRGEDGMLTAHGRPLFGAAPGEHLRLTGTWVTHPRYGRQLKAARCERTCSPRRRTPQESAHPPADSPRLHLAVTLPVDFTAFCELHHTHYTCYARLRLHAAAADHAVQATFGDLAVHWPRILRCPNPAAWAWNALKARITEALPAARSTPTDPSEPHPPAHRDLVEELRTHLPDHLADIVALHCAVHLTTAQVADVIGTDPATVAYHLRTAERRLSSHTPGLPATTRSAALTGRCT